MHFSLMNLKGSNVNAEEIYIFAILYNKPPSIQNKPIAVCVYLFLYDDMKNRKTTATKAPMSISLAAGLLWFFPSALTTFTGLAEESPFAVRPNGLIPSDC